MPSLSLVLNSVLLLSSGAAFVYGVIRFFKKGAALFNQLVVCGLGCMMLGRLFNVVTFIAGGTMTGGFSVGKLGFIGGFMFLFSASFGQMDGLVDGGEREFRKYRLIALIAPVLTLATYIPVAVSDAGLEEKIVAAVIIFFFAQCSYFNLKHLIIPDVDMGIIKSIRGYNLTALILTVFSTAELLSASFGGKVLQAVVAGLLSVTYLMVVPVLERGAKKWSI